MFRHTLAVLALSGALIPSAPHGITFAGGDGLGAGKHIVLISGDEEYRSEESLPMLGKLLSQRHGFKCTVLFAINRQTGEIDPNTLDNIPGLQALETADLMLINTRFRDLPDEQMKYIDAYLRSGKPVIGIRPAVVAFRQRNRDKHNPFARHSCGQRLKGGFGLDVLGADWKSHHGRHGKESTRGIPSVDQSDHPILRGVGTMWGATDVYTVHTPIQDLGAILVNGQVLEGMKPTALPSKKQQMPLAWTRHYAAEQGRGRVFMSTMGDARDFLDENFRRLLVNACFWAVGLEAKIPQRTNADLVGIYNPRPFGFNRFAKGLFPKDHAIDQKLLEAGDHICIIGNTLADRMQHHGWLETLIQTRHSRKNLVIRNLGFAADELGIRPRSMNFGSPDAHLAHSGADVVLAFFGYNESFAGAAGLPEFEKQLAAFVDHTLEQRYNGESAPRLVLFSPIAHEDLHDENLPNGTANNSRLSVYSEAMAKVARAKNILFVDLFTPTRKLYNEIDSPLTINGIHLNDEGNRRLARVIDETLSGTPNHTPVAQLQMVREAVLVKNLRWFNRYRTTDGYSTYGQRAFLKFTDGQSNKDVMDRELEIIDVMTSNRDRRIWALAQGHDTPVDDSSLPQPLVVKTNFGNHHASGRLIKSHSLDYLGGEAAIEKMRIAKGMEVRLFASEEQFEELVNPVQMSFDTDGRMWVAAWHTYPHWNPLEKLNDKLLIFPDEDGDGRADRCVVFADKLHNPTGFEFFGGGVLVACPPEILFLEDTDGDDKADRTTLITSGIDSADTHCGANSFVFGPDGCMYFSEGIFHFTNIESPWGPPLRTKAPMVYRWNPRTHEIDNHFFISPNPHGLVIDTWGRLFATDATSGRGYYVGYPKAGTPHDLYKKRVRPVAGFGRISGSHFPPENRGNLLICNTIGFRGILQHRMMHHGADVHSMEVEPIVVSTDTNFRPTDVEIGADGAMYFLDWHNAIIGHMQHNLRDPSRDNTHGRIYRVIAKGRPLLEPIKMRGKPIAELVALLGSPEDTVRYRARLELSGRDTTKVLAAARSFVDGLDATDPQHALALTEALWLHQQHNRRNRNLLLKVLGSKQAEARAAATRVIGQWGSSLVGGVALLQRMAADPSAMVRAEAVVAATSFEGLGAAEVVFIASRLPTDPQIAFNIRQTRRVTDPYWRAALKSGTTLSKAGGEFIRGLDKEKPRFQDLRQDTAANYLHVYLGSPSPKKHQVRGIAFQTKADGGKRFTVYQFRGGKKGKYTVVNAASFTASGNHGAKTIDFAHTWQVEAGDVFAHSGNGGPAYKAASSGHRDVLYFPVDSLPVHGRAYELRRLQRHTNKRRYALRFLAVEPKPRKADVVIKSVPEQLKYDIKMFTVKAGRPFVLRFVNPDNMPHNIVFTKIGAREEVGRLADILAGDPDAAKQHYVPRSDKILFASPVIDDHSKMTLDFTAPAKPGDYPFLCTLPGHWRIMHGVMRVVK